MRDFLLKLESFCNADGVSGYEAEGGIFDLIISEIKDYADEMYFDKSDNLIVFKKGRKIPEKKVVFAAHADEVGFVIKHINDDGTLLFDGMGISASSEPCERVRVGNKKLMGVIGMPPIHLLSEEDRKKKVTEAGLYIDIGAKNREEAAKAVNIGDYVSYASEFVRLSETRVKSKALDDRIGCLILCELIKSELEYDSFFAFTTGEELGTRGAFAAASGINPDIAVIVESTTASDTCGNDGKDAVCRLGEGAVMPFMDGGTVYDRDLRAFALALSEKLGIKTQTKTKVAGGTDARTFQRTTGGVKVLGVALPCRYIHTSASVADAEDMKATRSLVFALAERLGGVRL